MYKVISNLLFFLVIVMIGLTAYSMFSGKVEFIPYIQILFALVLVSWGTLEYKIEFKEDGKKTFYLYFVLAIISFGAAIFNFLGD